MCVGDTREVGLRLDSPPAHPPWQEKGDRGSCRGRPATSKCGRREGSERRAGRPSRHPPPLCAHPCEEGTRTGGGGGGGPAAPARAEPAAAAPCRAAVRSAAAAAPHAARCGPRHEWAGGPATRKGRSERCARALQRAARWVSRGGRPAGGSRRAGRRPPQAGTKSGVSERPVGPHRPTQLPNELGSMTTAAWRRRFALAVPPPTATDRGVPCLAARRSDDRQRATSGRAPPTTDRPCETRVAPLPAARPAAAAAAAPPPWWQGRPGWRGGGGGGCWRPPGRRPGPRSPRPHPLLRRASAAVGPPRQLRREGGGGGWWRKCIDRCRQRFNEIGAHRPARGCRWPR